MKRLLGGKSSNPAVVSPPVVRVILRRLPSVCHPLCVTRISGRRPSLLGYDMNRTFDMDETAVLRVSLNMVRVT